MKFRTVPFALAFGIFVLDRLTKLIVKTHVTALETLRVIPGFFNIVHAENPGVAFGFLAEGESVHLVAGSDNRARVLPDDLLALVQRP